MSEPKSPQPYKLDSSEDFFFSLGAQVGAHPLALAGMIHKVQDEFGFKTHADWQNFLAGARSAVA
jgi:hypothetical protein